MTKRRVAVLRGGMSSEYAVSLKTGLAVLETLAELGVHTKDIVIAKNGEWLHNGYVKTPTQALFDVDVVFIALHGKYGEDGTVQRILNQLHVPYTGSSPYSSAIALNKFLSKEILKKNDIQVPKHMRVSAQPNLNHHRIADSIDKMFGPKYILKPVTGGSSIGTTTANGVTELAKALETSLAEHDEVIVEERISGKEVTVNILNDFRNEDTYVFPVNEILLSDEFEYQSAEAKEANKVEFLCPGEFSLHEKKELEEIAKKAHTLLDLSQYSRSDFIVNDSGIYFLEINTQPPLHADSAYVKSLDSVGTTQKAIIEQLLFTATSNK